LLKVWGKYTNYINKVKNHEIPLAYDRSEVDKILVGIGIPVDLMGWFEEDYR
jgi:hypothetical protein